MIKVAPSIAAAPLTNLGQTIRDLETGGADMLHFDVEDGSFVPAMTLGIKVIRELRPLTKLPFDVHLMMVDPEWVLPELAALGTDRVSVHYEACRYPRRVLGLIAGLGMRAGLAFNPKTPIPALKFCLPYLSFVVVLTTEPETEEWAYLPSTLQKICAGKRQPGLAALEWVVDGGITAENVQEAASAGADVVVCGRGVFQAGQVQENIQRLKARSQIAI